MSLIQKQIKEKVCPNCSATEKYGSFEPISMVYNDRVGKVLEEECPSCGAYVFFGEKIKPHAITISELLETNNSFRKLLMVCPELNKLVRVHLAQKEKEDNLVM